MKYVKLLKEESNVAYVDDLSYHGVENAIDSIFNMGGINTSTIEPTLKLGQSGEYIFGGNKKSKTIFIKVKEDMENGKYVLLMREK